MRFLVLALINLVIKVLQGTEKEYDKENAKLTAVCEKIKISKTVPHRKQFCLDFEIE